MIVPASVPSAVGPLPFKPVQADQDQASQGICYRKITALRDDARRNREKWRFL